MISNKYIKIGPTADSIPFDNQNDPDCGLISDTVQEAIDELCRKALINSSPGIAFGRNGQINKGAWLLNNEVSSNLTGVPFALNNGILVSLWIGNEDIKTFDVTLYEHDGDEIGLTSLVTVSLVATRSAFFDTSDFGTINLTKDKQLACRITDGNGKNIKVFTVVKGDTV